MSFSPTRRVLLAAAAGAAVSTAVTTPARAADGYDPLLEWYDLTTETVAASGVMTGIVNARVWAIAWIAAARAGHGAALVGAVHHALATLVPSRVTELTAAREASLRRLGGDSDPRVHAAAERGRRIAAIVLAEREGDGLDLGSVNRPFTPPPAAPGVWRPTPPAHSPAVQAGQGAGRPFILDSARRFRPGPPPGLDSGAYRRDLAEVRAYGGSTSELRTKQQTDIAMFWVQSPLLPYGAAIRAVLTGSRDPGRARLVALFHAITADAVISVFEAKYHYVWWRPVTAIRAAGEASWLPLMVNTPAHPEYPSGHACYAGAAEVVLGALAGQPRRPIELTSPTAPGVTLRYARWAELTRDNIDGRVWVGVHYRTSDEVGAAIGRRVAHWTLRNGAWL